MKEEQLVEGLHQLGCNQELITDLIDLNTKGQTAEQLRLLAGKKKELLQTLHDSQKKIDCLDYLTFHVKENPQKEVKK